MQYFILLILILGLIGLILMIYSIIKKSGRIKVLMHAFLCLFAIFVLIWYLSPAKYNLREDVNITIISTANNTIVKTDYAQKSELKSLINNLYFKRQFFNGYEHLMFNNDKYVYVLITGVTGAQSPIGLHMTMNEDGFANGEGYCIDNNYAEIINPELLIQYVKSILQEA